MDPLRLVVAGAGIAVLVAMVWGDWRVRSARTLGLLGVVAGVLAVSAFTNWIPALVAWLLAGGLLGLIMFHPPWLAPLKRSDLSMVEQISGIERALIDVSDAYRRGRLGPTELNDKLVQIRRRAAKLQAPDAEWERMIRLLAGEMERTIAAIAGRQQRSDDAVDKGRRRFRTTYTSFVKDRLRFWR